MFLSADPVRESDVAQAIKALDAAYQACAADQAALRKFFSDLGAPLP